MNGRPPAPGAQICAGPQRSLLLNETAIVIGSTPFLPTDLPTDLRTDLPAGPAAGDWTAGRYVAPFDVVEIGLDPPRLRSRERGEVAVRPLDRTRWATDLGVVEFGDDRLRLSEAYVFRRV